MEKTKLYSEISKMSNKHILYLLKLTSDTESFCKIGITSKTIEERMSWVENYKYEYIYSIDGDGYQIRGLESILKEKILDYDKHYQPKTKINGYTECYKIDYLDEIKSVFKYIDNKNNKKIIPKQKTVTYTEIIPKQKTPTYTKVYNYLYNFNELTNNDIFLLSFIISHSENNQDFFYTNEQIVKHFNNKLGQNTMINNRIKTLKDNGFIVTSTSKEVYPDKKWGNRRVITLGPKLLNNQI